MQRADVPVDGLPRLGAEDAKVTLVELTDYDCPFCARAESTVASLRQRYGNDLRVVIAENPLPMHEHAEAAALFALTANQAGAFEAAHARLFANPSKHSDDDLRALGRELGISGVQRSAAANASAKASLGASRELARALRVTGTPTFFVNGRKIEGAQAQETFREIIDEELAHANALVAQGVAQKDLYAHIREEARSNPANVPAHNPAECDAKDAPDDDLSFVTAAKGAGGLYLMGNPRGTRTLTLFTDLECPYCARLDTQLRDFVTTHSELRVLVRQRPLPMHPNAETWALAALAADAQGRLAPFVQAAFALKGDKGGDALDKLAAKIGLDVARLHRDMDSADTHAKLRADLALAETLAVKGTPTSFIDGYKVIGAQPENVFSEALAKAGTSL